MALRVVHCGTGNVGGAGLAGIINHPDLELVGQYVWSPGKVGVDSGALCGLPDTGVIATHDWDAALRPRRRLPVALRRQHRPRAAGRGGRLPGSWNGARTSVTISVFPWAYPPAVPAEFRAPVEAACAKGGTTAFFSGIDPGWATTDLAIAALACGDRIDCVRVQELGWFGQYSAEFAMPPVLRLRATRRLRAHPPVRRLPEADVGTHTAAHRRRARRRDRRLEHRVRNRFARRRHRDRLRH